MQPTYQTRALQQKSSNKIVQNNLLKRQKLTDRYKNIKMLSHANTDFRLIMEKTRLVQAQEY